MRMYVFVRYPLVFSNVCSGGLAHEKNAIELISIVHMRDVDKMCSLAGSSFMELPQCHQCC